MPYDPRMQQMIRGGIGRMGPGASPFDRAEQPPRWWEQPPPQPQARPDDSAVPQPATQPPNTAKQPSLLEMGLNVGRMTRPQYDQALKGSGGPYGSPNAAAMVSPWAWLGSMWGGPGGGK